MITKFSFPFSFFFFGSKKTASECVCLNSDPEAALLPSRSTTEQLIDCSVCSVRMRNGGFSVPNRLRVPKHLFRIDRFFDRGQSLIGGTTVIQTMRLCGREVGVNVIQISIESGFRLRADKGIIHPVHEISDCCRKRRLGTVAACQIMKHPKAAAVSIGG